MNPTTADPDSVGFDRPPPGRPAPGPAYYARRVLKAMASLQLTVVLFSLSILLVFFGTLAQVDFGIGTVVEKYFWSWAVWVPVDLFNKFGQVFFADQFPKVRWEGAFPFPGGKLLGGAMLVNLLAAHLVRFRVTWKRSGILLIHGGLILLFVGEFVTREYAVEQRMTINEGSSVNFTEDTKSVELVFVDKSSRTEDRITVIPESVLRGATGRITHPDLPVDVEVVEYMTNSSLDDPGDGKPNPASSGLGRDLRAVKRADVSGVDPNQKVDLPAAYVKLFRKGTDEVIGTFLVSLMLTLQGESDRVAAGGKEYEIALRYKRYYKPYNLYLIDFRFDKYPGTEKPKNYSSQVILRDPEEKLEREVTIRMNEPLRHRGETFYQVNFDHAGEAVETTVLQVVKNPGWRIPYVSCVVVTLGLVLHFGIYLVQFLTRRAAA